MEMGKRAGKTEADSSCTDEEVQARERQLNQAIKDDLIGIDDLAQGLDDDSIIDEDGQDFEDNQPDSQEDSSSGDFMDEELPDKDAFSTEKIDSNDFLDDDDETNTYTNDRHYSQDPSDAPIASLDLNELYVRRLPPEIAPRSLSNFNHEITPTPELVKFTCSFLAPPPSLSKVPNNFFLQCYKKYRSNHGITGKENLPKTALTAPNEPPLLIWRWVRVQKIYLALNPEQRLTMRKIYKGFVNFLRLHGELFELSEDLMHVIAHDPQGILAPIVPTQKDFRFQQRVVLPSDFDDDTRSTAALIGEKARQKYQAILGNSQIPTLRKQLILLDPHNPLLNRDVWCDEVAQLLPNDRAIKKNTMLTKLPPILKAALGRHAKAHLVPHTNEYFTIFIDEGVSMIQKTKLYKTKELQLPLLSSDDSVEALRAAVPVGGATLLALQYLHLSKPAVKGLKEHFGGIYTAVKAHPQYFNICSSPTGKLADSLVTIIE
ncbi:unnamed protein product [Phytomonas sp. Hart1]|nr:unnamed protein product [Phytomonas sp. Hart1]|eukprot:CCW66575.1 unnamed protein product [Phytomonas sp. isolate Hart1]